MRCYIAHCRSHYQCHESERDEDNLERPRIPDSLNVCHIIVMCHKTSVVYYKVSLCVCLLKVNTHYDALALIALEVATREIKWIAVESPV